MEKLIEDTLHKVVVASKREARSGGRKCHVAFMSRHSRDTVCRLDYDGTSRTDAAISKLEQGLASLGFPESRVSELQVATPRGSGKFSHYTATVGWTPAVKEVRKQATPTSLRSLQTRSSTSSSGTGSGIRGGQFPQNVEEVPRSASCPALFETAAVPQRVWSAPPVPSPPARSPARHCLSTPNSNAIDAEKKGTSGDVRPSRSSSTSGGRNRNASSSRAVRPDSRDAIRPKPVRRQMHLQRRKPSMPSNTAARAQVRSRQGGESHTRLRRSSSCGSVPCRSFDLTKQSRTDEGQVTNSLSRAQAA